ncbi:MAG: hypothetical protein VR69_17335 [Peptococcaceae bacterium BRH_c4b]|nr:MAG: hypothetical protein VR69_17335 [Peptococcaceae bacterium BRH_c4b]
MDKNVSPSRQQDDVLIKLTQDIMKGAKIRLVEPVVAENRRLAEMLQAIQKQEKDEFAHIKVRLDLLEQSVQQIPVLILAAIRDAINQAGVEVRP